MKQLASKRPRSNDLRNISDLQFVAACLISKQVEEDGLGEGIELGDGGAALGAQGVGVIEDGGDAALFGERGEGISSFFSLVRYTPA